MSAAVGDVFKVSLTGSVVAYGQVAASYGTGGGHFYLLGFRGEFAAGDTPALQAITEDRALIALSMDPLLRIGHWPIVGNRPVDEERIPWPTYKVAVRPDAYIVEDHAGRRLRDATDHDVATLRFRSVIAPIRFENALKALHDHGAWLPEYDGLILP